ncbi:energy transducer TonB [Reichenbachiella versicolor]|uniref:energy transducer TonB n=1 Tax=Reichenbachiella versicolor TaxID=1821036 RepID=UPI001FEB7997|nr:energy transducer TonB [Reichenbachiella versicolor]
MNNVDKSRSSGLDKGSNKRREHNVETRKQSVISTSQEKSFLLFKSDLDDLMKIKQEKNERGRVNRFLFFTIGLVLSLLFVNLAFQWKFYDDATVTSLGLLEAEEIDELYEIPLTNQPPPPPPQVQQQVVIVEVKDEVILEEVDIDFDVEVTEETAIEEIVFEEVAIEEQEEVEEVFQIVEKAPFPKGGMKEFYKYVANNLNYPRMATRQGIEGRVFVQFVVGSTGEIREVQVVKGIGGGCDEEAQKIIENAPAWVPGKQRGKSVSVRMIIPITFIMAK